MKLEFKRTEVELNIYGQEISITMPTEDQVLSLQEEVASAKGGEDGAAVLLARRKFLVGLGVPEEILKDMEFKHVTQLAEGLMGDLVKKA